MTCCWNWNKDHITRTPFLQNLHTLASDQIPSNTQTMYTWCELVTVLPTCQPLLIYPVMSFRHIFQLKLNPAELVLCLWHQYWCWIYDTQSRCCGTSRKPFKIQCSVISQRFIDTHVLGVLFLRTLAGSRWGNALKSGLTSIMSWCDIIYQIVYSVMINDIESDIQWQNIFWR